MTNEKMAARLEKRAAQAKAAGTPVWIDEDDEAAVLAGAKALREVERKGARIAELEAALREERDRMKSLKTNRLYREYTEVTVDELEEHIALIDAALKGAQ